MQAEERVVLLAKAIRDYELADKERASLREEVGGLSKLMSKSRIIWEGGLLKAGNGLFFYYIKFLSLERFLGECVKA